MMAVSETCRIYTLYTTTPNGLDCQFSLNALWVKTVHMTVLLPRNGKKLIIFDRFQYLELVNKENEGSPTPSCVLSLLPIYYSMKTGYFM